MSTQASPTLSLEEVEALDEFTLGRWSEDRRKLRNTAISLYRQLAEARAECEQKSEMLRKCSVEIGLLRGEALAAERLLAQERERCAKVAEDFDNRNPFPTVYGAIAAAIRALPPAQEG